MQCIIEITNEGVIIPKNIGNLSIGKYYLKPIEPENKEKASTNFGHILVEDVINYYIFPEGGDGEKARIMFGRSIGSIMRFINLKFDIKSKSDMYLDLLNGQAIGAIKRVPFCGKTIISVIEKICKDFGIMTLGIPSNTQIPDYCKNVKFLG